MFFRIPRRSRITQKKVFARTLVIPRPGEGQKMAWSAHLQTRRTVEKNADVTLEKFKERGHPIFRGISALNRGALKRKGGRCTIHFTAESSNAELLFRAIHSANQLSICGAAATRCGDFGSTDSWLNTHDHVKICRDGKLPVISKIGAARSGFFGTDTKEE